MRSERQISRDPTESALTIRNNIREPTMNAGMVKMEGGVVGLNINVAADRFLVGTMNVMQENDCLNRDSKITEDSRCVSGGSMEKEELGDGRFDHLVSTNVNLPYLHFALQDAAKQLTAQNIPVQSVSVDEPPCKKPRPKYKPSRPPLLPPCRVCGDRASGFHYGVNTCEACKGFFRRSICKTEPYACSSSQNCLLVPGKRTACSYCRFQRCLEVGMSKGAIKTGRYTHELRSKNIIEVKRLEKQNSGEAFDESTHRNPCLVPVRQATTESHDNDQSLQTVLLEETLTVLVSAQKHLFEYLDDYYREELMLKRQQDVFRKYVEKKCQSPGAAERLPLISVKTESADDGHRRPSSSPGWHGLDNCRPNLPEGGSSSAGRHRSSILNGLLTQRNLAQTLTNGVHELKIGNTRNPHSQNPSDLDFGEFKSDASTGTWHKPSRHNNEHERHVQATAAPVSPARQERTKADVMCQVLKDMEQGVQGMLAFAKSLPGFKDLSREDQAALLKASRFDIWYIGHIRCFNVDLKVGACEWEFHAEELAQVWGADLVELAFKLSRQGLTLQLTKEETAAFRAVCLTFSDRCPTLQARARVDQMHALMWDVLRQAVSRRHGQYNRWFSQAISFLMLLREFGIKFEKVSSEVQLDWSVLAENPLLLSVFLS
ncbi:nuclear receptor subfamily 1 group D member 2-like [Mya arenaria]|uniref:nuclear receptor subfamily 1 group D member 2-like n=1 Tax=Mya arenaria TaxID=6604 RepID=UPI0022E1038C|nr:nuclear receptor subfamily 1 group D member 2-like [Mya arenaria]